MKTALTLILTGIGLFILSVAAWLTHVIWWVKLMMNEQMDTFGEWALAIIGLFFPPIGVIHGIILWL